MLAVAIDHYVINVLYREVSFTYNTPSNGRFDEKEI